MKRKHLWLVALAVGCTLPLGMNCLNEPDLGQIGVIALPSPAGLISSLLASIGLPALPTDPTQLLAWIQQVFGSLTT
jgi:hypothetical protein